MNVSKLEQKVTQESLFNFQDFWMRFSKISKTRLIFILRHKL